MNFSKETWENLPKCQRAYLRGFRDGENHVINTTLKAIVKGEKVKL